MFAQAVVHNARGKYDAHSNFKSNLTGQSSQMIFPPKPVGQGPFELAQTCQCFVWCDMNTVYYNYFFLKNNATKTCMQVVQQLNGRRPFSFTAAHRSVLHMTSFARTQKVSCYGRWGDILVNKRRLDQISYRGGLHSIQLKARQRSDDDPTTNAGWVALHFSMGFGPVFTCIRKPIALWFSAGGGVRTPSPPILWI